MSKNAWSYASTPQYTFMAWCSVKNYRDNFTFNKVLYLLYYTYLMNSCFILCMYIIFNTLHKQCNHNVAFNLHMINLVHFRKKHWNILTYHSVHVLKKKVCHVAHRFHYLLLWRRMVISLLCIRPIWLRSDERTVDFSLMDRSQDSSIGVETGWTIGWLGFDFWGGLGTFLFDTRYRSALGPT
jgi:hypothetical protein